MSHSPRRPVVQLLHARIWEHGRGAVARGGGRRCRPGGAALGAVDQGWGGRRVEDQGDPVVHDEMTTDESLARSDPDRGICWWSGDVIVVTTDTIPGKVVTEPLGVCMGDTRARGV